MAPEDGWFEGKDEPSGLDDVAWSSGGPRTPDLQYDPLEPGPDGPTDSPVRLDSADGSSLLFRIALSTAALLVLFVLARGLWWPGSKPRPNAPQGTAPRAPAASPAPAPAVKPRPPEVIEEPVIEEEPPDLPPEPIPLEPETPAPMVIAEVPAPAAPVPQQAAPLQEPAAAPAPARRLPPPWEEGPQPADLLKPGPGVEEPVPMELPRYSYPTAAQGTGLQVDVRLALLVDERGRVIEARVREGAPPDLGFAETALAVAKRISFQPATRYDVPGKMWTEVILEFVE